MQELLSPKQVARALDVSESSVKRWCDNGAIQATYTAGGHRRISVDGVMAFIQSRKIALVFPEALGLPATSSRSSRSLLRGKELLIESIIVGDEASCQQIIIDLYVVEHSVSSICDDVIAAAFHEIGERWNCGEAEIYQERRACEIACRLFDELRVLLPPPSPAAGIAIGGSPAGDPYNLCNKMGELVLRNRNWDATSLGNDLPFDTLSAAINFHRPTIFWLSCSHISDEHAFLSGFKALYEEHHASVAFVVGGRALTPDVREAMPDVEFCQSMQQLEAFADSILCKKNST